MRLTVYFDGQFWLGIIEVSEAGYLKVFRYVFGTEPSNPAILSFVRHQLPRLLANRKLAESGDGATDNRYPVHPKRAQRMAAKEMKKKGIGTRAQNAMKLAISTRKTEIKRNAKIRRENLIRERYLLRKEKARQKHRGK